MKCSHLDTCHQTELILTRANYLLTYLLIYLLFHSRVAELLCQKFCTMHFLTTCGYIKSQVKCTLIMITVENSFHISMQRERIILWVLKISRKDNRIIQIKEQKDKKKNESFQITTIVVVCFYNYLELGFCVIAIWH